MILIRKAYVPVRLNSRTVDAPTVLSYQCKEELKLCQTRPRRQ
jgi:hypothetical protein